MEEIVKEKIEEIPSIWDDLDDLEIPDTEDEGSEEDYLDSDFVSDCFSCQEIFKLRKTPKKCKCVVCREEFILEEWEVCKGMRKKSLTDVDTRYVYVCPNCVRDVNWRDNWKAYKNEQKIRPKESVLNWNKR